MIHHPGHNCTCKCYGCTHHCGAHWPVWYRIAWQVKFWTVTAPVQRLEEWKGTK